MIFRVNGTTVETTYNADHNVWFAKVSDKQNCYAKNRRLRQGEYDFFNGIVANIDYQGKNPFNGDCIDDAVMTFTAPCLISDSDGSPCG